MLNVTPPIQISMYVHISAIVVYFSKMAELFLDLLFAWLE
jgi:hypothetical protein